MYPSNDDQYEEHEITSVEGKSIGFGGYGIAVPADSPVEPKVGMAVRLYGRGFGSRVRGMFLDGQKVYYRTEHEDREYAEIKLYGADAADWLKRWDEGRTVWSIEMGGMGPGYEQAIQITVAEALRIMLDKGFDASKWEDQDEWKRDRETIDQITLKSETIDKLGLSGAQWGAALSCATHLYMHGPRKVMNDERVKDRKIQVSKSFPVAA